MKCENCNEEIVGKGQFCSNCGQKNIDELNLKYIISQFVEDFFNVDSKFFNTIKFLSIRPGFLSKEYIDGRRVKYVPPIRLYIVISVVFFFVLSVVDYSSVPDTNITIGTPDTNEEQVDGVKFTVDGETINIPTSELKRLEYEGRLEEGLDSLTAEMPEFAGYISRKMAMTKINDEGFLDVLSDQFSLFLLLFLPFFALLYAIVFSASKKGFIGNLIFNIHINSFVMFSLLCYFFLDLFIQNNEVLEYLLFSLVFIFGQYYLIRAIMRFYNRNWYIALYKYFLLLLGYSVLAIVFFIFVFASSIFLF